MVPTKKVAGKAKRTAKKVAPPIDFKAPEVKEDLGKIVLVEGEAPELFKKAKPVEKPKKEMPKLKSAGETAWALLDAAPEMPHLVTIQDAVKFADEYTRWKRDVKGAKHS